MFLILFRSIPQPWYLNPLNDLRSKPLCKGWLCNTSDNSLEIHDFEQIIIDYEEERRKMDLKAELLNVSKNEPLAHCAIGLLYQIGFDNFEQNFKLARDHYEKGSNTLFCKEGLLFHPWNTGNLNIEQIRQMANLGSAWAMTALATFEPNQIPSCKNETVDTQEKARWLRHLAAAQSKGWWRRRRSGISYAKAVSILTGISVSSDPAQRQQQEVQAWKVMRKLASIGVLPAAIWVSDGLSSGKIGYKNDEEAVKVLRDFVASGPWAFDIEELLQNAKGIEEIFRLSSMFGSKEAIALKSFSQFQNVN